MLCVSSRNALCMNQPYVPQQRILPDFSQDARLVHCDGKVLFAKDSSVTGTILKCSKLLHCKSFLPILCSYFYVPTDDRFTWVLSPVFWDAFGNDSLDFSGFESWQLLSFFWRLSPQWDRSFYGLSVPFLPTVC